MEISSFPAQLCDVCSYSVKEKPWRVSDLGPEEFFPESLLLFDQFEDRLVALHFPAAEVSDDVGVKLQVGFVRPPAHSAAAHDQKRERERESQPEEKYFLYRGHLSTPQADTSDMYLNLFFLLNCFYSVIFRANPPAV